MSRFTDKKIDDVWNKAKFPIEDEKTVWRKDYAGAWIKKSEYGKEAEYGWEIDHVKPSSKGGSDVIGNLVPLHWHNNRTKADNYPNFETSISSDGSKNIEKTTSWNY